MNQEKNLNISGISKLLTFISMANLKYKPTTKDMIASAKFMLPGASDEIFVRIAASNPGFDPNKVHFVTDKGQEYKGTYNGSDGWMLTLVGGAVNDGQHLYVVQETTKGKSETLARLNIFTYEPKSIKVRLVPVNGFTNGLTAQEVDRQLNAIYNKVGIDCEVEMAPSFNHPFPNNTFNVTGSGLFSTLTDDMKALNAAYLLENPDEDALCLFIIEQVSGNEGIVGDMPRGKQFGYLFGGATTQTIAHEIAHGLFHLDHPFDRANAAKSFDRGDLSDNLMEYGSGTNLVKLQWDAIHAPGLVIGVFERDEGAMVYSKTQITSLFNNIRSKNSNKNISVGTIVRAIDIYQDKFIEDSAQYVSMTKEYFLSSLTHEQIETFNNQQIRNDGAGDQNSIVLANKAHIKLKLDNKKDSTEFVVSVNGYSVTNNIFTAWITTEENDNRMVFYNAIYAGRNDKITEKDVRSNRKAFDIIVHHSDGFGTFEELKTYLKIKGYIDFSNIPDDKVILELKRKKSNEYVTIGELIIKGTDIKFFTLELGRNKNTSPASNCSTKSHDQYLCERIKAGTYKLELNDAGGSAMQHRYKSLRLDNVPNRSGILIHRGNAYLWTQGCILLMVANEIDNVLENPEQFMDGETQGFNYSVEYQVPILALYDYIEKYGNPIKINEKTFMSEIVITDDDDVNISNNNKFTKEINDRREAARLYYDNEKLIQSTMNNATESLMKAIIDDILYQELSLEGNVKYTNIDSAIQTDNFKKKINEKAIRDMIISNLTDSLITSYISTVFSNIQSDKENILKKFFRDSKSAPFSPIYYINRQYRKYLKNNNWEYWEYGEYLTNNVTQQKINEYVWQHKNKYKK
jgi:hypothetical protein